MSNYLLKENDAAKEVKNIIKSFRMTCVYFAFPCKHYLYSLQANYRYIYSTSKQGLSTLYTSVKAIAHLGKTHYW